MNFPKQFRQPHPLRLPHRDGDQFGWFEIPGRRSLRIMAVAASQHVPWDHISVSGLDQLTRKAFTPNWDEMCRVKSIFWGEDEVVVQFHPAAKDYVNFARHCLHLWKFAGEMPSPPTWAIGPKSGETVSQAIATANKEVRGE